MCHPHQSKSKQRHDLQNNLQISLETVSVVTFGELMVKETKSGTKSSDLQPGCIAAFFSLCLSLYPSSCQVPWFTPSSRVFQSFFTKRSSIENSQLKCIFTF
eukprot:EG_transcript_56244